MQHARHHSIRIGEHLQGAQGDVVPARAAQTLRQQAGTLTHRSARIVRLAIGARHQRHSRRNARVRRDHGSHTQRGHRLSSQLLRGVRDQSDVALTAGHTHTVSLQARHQIVQQPVAQIRGVRIVSRQERVTRQGLGYALCLRLHLFTRLTFRMLTQQVVEIHRAMMQLLRIQLRRVNARDNAQGTAGTSQRHHKALTTVFGRQLTQIVGRLTQAGTTHTQGENHGIAFEGLGTGQVDHAERLLTSGEERRQLRVQAQGVTYRLSHTLSALRASRHHRQRPVRGAVRVLEHQVRHALHLNTGRIQVRVIAHFTASINVLNGQRTGGLG